VRLGLPKEFAPTNPTPRYALGAQLANQDPSPLVAYLGRPCQFLDNEQLQFCDPQLWTNGRFSEQALNMGNSAIDLLINEIHSQQKLSVRSIHLVGYSGGGTYATLLASRRSDVSCLSDRAAATTGSGCLGQVSSRCPIKRFPEPSHSYATPFKHKPNALVWSQRSSGATASSRAI
jgi:pimeloyl-ACP methyl ester carboxylesterase